MLGVAAICGDDRVVARSEVGAQGRTPLAFSVAEPIVLVPLVKVTVPVGMTPVHLYPRRSPPGWIVRSLPVVAVVLRSVEVGMVPTTSETAVDVLPVSLVSPDKRP